MHVGSGMQMLPGATVRDRPHNICPLCHNEMCEKCVRSRLECFPFTFPRLMLWRSVSTAVTDWLPVYK